MPRGKVVRIHAVLCRMSPKRLTPSHSLTHPPDAFQLAVALGDKWSYPPALACADYLSDDKTIPFKLFDGHHRVHAALLKNIHTIPVYTFPFNEYVDVIARYFKGIAPMIYSRLDRYIILPDGKTYEASGIRV